MPKKKPNFIPFGNKKSGKGGGPKPPKPSKKVTRKTHGDGRKGSNSQG